MPRPILSEAHTHTAIREKIANYHVSTLSEVQNAIAQHTVVVVGMTQNPVVKKARKILDAENVSYHYLEYGSYLSQWKPRLALKLWSGWPTFPMIFIKGVLIGGAEDLQRLVASGDLKLMLG
jgi:monothiol glutaredoxin